MTFDRKQTTPDKASEQRKTQVQKVEKKTTTLKLNTLLFLLLLTFASLTQEICLPKPPPTLELDAHIWQPMTELHVGNPHDGTEILLYDEMNDTLTSISWQQPTFHLFFGTPFTGYLYYKGPAMGSNFHEVLPSNVKGRQVFNSRYNEFCVAIEMDDTKLRKVMTRTNSLQLTAACVPCSSIACTRDFTPCFCGWNKTSGGQQVGVTWWPPIPKATPQNIRPGKLWEALWITQTSAYLGVSSTNLNIAWSTRHFWVNTVYPNCTKAISILWKQHEWWLEQHWPRSPRWKRDIFNIGSGLGILSQGEFLANEERHEREKQLLSQIEHLEGLLFQEQSKGWEVAWKDNEALKKWIDKTRQKMTEYAKTEAWEKACVITQQGLLSMLIEMESHVAEKRWPPILTAEAQKSSFWDTHGNPSLWKIFDGKCNTYRCTMTALAPKMDSDLKFSVVQLVGVGEIHNHTRILPVGSRWAVLTSNTTWEPISLLNCETRQGLWLCPQMRWDSELAQSWPITTTRSENNIWYMGKGRFCWEGQNGSQVELQTLLCEATTYYMNETRIWCNTGIVGSIKLPEVNKTYINTDIDDSIYWSITLEPPSHIESMENNWPEEELKLADEELKKVLTESSQIYHKVQIETEEGGKRIIKLVQDYNKTCAGFFGWIGCLFGALPFAETIGKYFTVIIVVLIIYFILLKCTVCWLRFRKK